MDILTHLQHLFNITPDFEPFWNHISQPNYSLTCYGQFIRKILDDTIPHKIELVASRNSFNYSSFAKNLNNITKTELQTLRTGFINEYYIPWKSCEIYITITHNVIDFLCQPNSLSVNLLAYHFPTQSFYLRPSSLGKWLSIPLARKQEIRDNIIREIQEKKFSIISVENHQKTLLAASQLILEEGYSYTDSTTQKTLIKSLNGIFNHNYFISEEDRDYLLHPSIRVVYQQILQKADYLSIPTTQNMLQYACYNNLEEFFHWVVWRSQISLHKIENNHIFQMIKYLLKHQSTPLYPALLLHLPPTKYTKLIYHICQTGTLNQFQQTLNFWHLKPSNFHKPNIGDLIEAACSNPNPEIINYLLKQPLIHIPNSWSIMSALQSGNMTLAHKLEQLGYQIPHKPSMHRFTLLETHNTPALQFLHTKYNYPFSQTDLEYTITQYTHPNNIHKLKKTIRWFISNISVNIHDILQKILYNHPELSYLLWPYVSTNKLILHTHNFYQAIQEPHAILAQAHIILAQTKIPESLYSEVTKYIH